MPEHDPSRSPRPEVVNPYGPPAPKAPATEPSWPDPTWQVVGAPAPASPVIVPSRGRLGTGGIVAIVAGSLAILLVVAGLAGTAGFLAGYGFGGATIEDDYYGGEELPVARGTVVDRQGQEVPGVGTYEAPALQVEHGLSWPLLEGGTVTYVVDGVDWAADDEIAAVSPDNPPPSAGTRYVLVSLHGTYSGPGHVDLEEQLYFDIETDEEVFVADTTLAIPPEPLWRQGGITDGQSAAGQLLLEIPLDVDPAAAVISLSTWDGDVLYVEAG